MKLTHINPDSMHKNPAFSQGISIEDYSKLLFIGGQNGVNEKGEVVGNDLNSQTVQALNNVLTVLKTVDANQQNVVSMKIYVVAGQNIQDGYTAAFKVWGMNPTTISVMFVAALGRPEVLVEIEAIAAI